MKISMRVVIISQTRTKLSEMEMLNQSQGLVHQAELGQGQGQGQGNEVEPMAAQLYIPLCS